MSGPADVHVDGGTPSVVILIVIVIVRTATVVKFARYAEISTSSFLSAAAATLEATAPGASS